MSKYEYKDEEGIAEMGCKGRAKAQTTPAQQSTTGTMQEEYEGACDATIHNAASHVITIDSDEPSPLPLTPPFPIDATLPWLNDEEDNSGDDGDSAFYAYAAGRRMTSQDEDVEADEDGEQWEYSGLSNITQSISRRFIGAMRGLFPLLSVNFGLEPDEIAGITMESPIRTYDAIGRLIEITGGDNESLVEVHRRMRMILVNEINNAMMILRSGDDEHRQRMSAKALAELAEIGVSSVLSLRERQRLVVVLTETILDPRRVNLNSEGRDAKKYAIRALEDMVATGGIGLDKAESVGAEHIVHTLLDVIHSRDLDQRIASDAIQALEKILDSVSSATPNLVPETVARIRQWKMELIHRILAVSRLRSTYWTTRDEGSRVVARYIADASADPDAPHIPVAEAIALYDELLSLADPAASSASPRSVVANDVEDEAQMRIFAIKTIGGAAGKLIAKGERGDEWNTRIHRATEVILANLPANLSANLVDSRVQEEAARVIKDMWENAYGGMVAQPSTSGVSASGDKERRNPHALYPAHSQVLNEALSGLIDVLLAEEKGKQSRSVHHAALYTLSYVLVLGERVSDNIAGNATDETAPHVNNIIELERGQLASLTQTVLSLVEEAGTKDVVQRRDGVLVLARLMQYAARRHYLVHTRSENPIVSKVEARRILDTAAELAKESDAILRVPGLAALEILVATEIPSPPHRRPSSRRKPSEQPRRFLDLVFPDAHLDDEDEVLRSINLALRRATRSRNERIKTTAQRIKAELRSYLKSKKSRTKKSRARKS